MTPLFPAQRAAEDFETALGGTATQAVADRYSDLLETVEVLRTQPEVLPRVEFADDLRLRLMAAAETELVAAPNVVRLAPRRTSRTRRRLGTAAASLVIVGGTAGMAAAASGALPGEALYPVKLGVEQASEAVRMSDAGQGEALLRQAATRMDEVRALQAQGSADPELLATTLDSFRAAADEGSQKLFTAYQAEGDSQNITTVRDFTAAQMAEVGALAARTSNPSTDESLLDTADTLADIDQQARVLCGSCGPQAGLAPPEALSAGAGAAAADNLLARPAKQAQVDVAAVEAARSAALKAGASAAEATASTIPQIQDSPGGVAGAAGSAAERPPVASTISPNGSLVPSVTSAGKGAVKDLVTGVTGTVTDTTGKIVKPGTPLDDVVGGLTGTLDKTTDELLPDQD
jgi:Domain of unknown function (DUF5667)